MNVIPELKLDIDKLLRRSICIFGSTSSGKSTIVKEILSILKPHVEQIFVFCPTDKQNECYSSGIVPLPLIHPEITDELLKHIWDRQQALVLAWRTVHNVDNLSAIYSKCVDQRVDSVLYNLQNIRNRCIEQIRMTYYDNIKIKSKIDDCDKKYTETLCNIYIDHINKNRAILADKQLTPEQQTVMKYLTINPNLVIIFDDCSAQFKSLNKESTRIIRELFYQGRHSWITPIFGLHTDKCIDAELRKQSFITIWTDIKTAQAYFGRSSNDFARDERKKVEELCRMVFPVDDVSKNDPSYYRKLAYLRDEKKYYKYTATLVEDFSFCSNVVKKFCQYVQRDGFSIDPSNKYMQELSIL